jgi:hypothetical protein
MREGVSGGALSAVTGIAQLARSLPSCPQFWHDNEHRKVSQPRCGVTLLRVADGKVHKPKSFVPQRTVVS